MAQLVEPLKISTQKIIAKMDGWCWVATSNFFGEFFKKQSFL